MAAIDRIETDLTAGRAGRIEAAGGARGWASIVRGSVFAARLATTCCIAFLLIFSVGVGGFTIGASAAWIANVTALAPYLPYFVAVTVALLVMGVVAVYCQPKAACVEKSSGRQGSTWIVRIGLWTAAVLVVVALVFPYLAPLIRPPLVFDL